jgi:putative ABC transport system permease protein
LRNVRDDLKTALRSFRAEKSFTAAALLVLTLGIGATTAIFSVVDAVVLRGLPFDEHDRLVAVGQRAVSADEQHAVRLPGFGQDRDPRQLRLVAPQNYLDWAAQQQVFDSMAAIASGWMTLREPGVEPESLVPQRVTADFFTVLRVKPAIGRAFTVQNEVAGRDRVAVLSDGLWRRRFGADPGIIGRTLALEDVEGGPPAAEAGYEVVGVMPPGFTYPVGASRATDVWIPYAVPARDRIRDPSRVSTYLQVIARLKPGVSVAQAQAQMDQIAAVIEQANPVWNKDSGIGVRPLIDHIVGARIRSWMLLLLAAVMLVLLIACANIASLLLARGSTRERDIAVRAALGASRSRLVRTLIVESLVLSAMGTGCAIVVAWWIVDILRASMPDGVPRVATIALDWRVLAAAAAASLVTALLFGLGPALQLSRPDLSNGLRDGARSGISAARQRLRSALVLAEVALAMVLLVGAALFIGSFLSVLRIDPGFSPDRVLSAQISPRLVSKPTDQVAALEEIVERVRGIPGVVHAAILSGFLPLGGGISMTSFPLRGRPDLPVAQLSTKRVTPEYHQALAIPLLRGRLFDNATDRKDFRDVAIINETAAKTFFPDADPIGRDLGGTAVVGVVGDVPQTSLEQETLPEMYRPLAQEEAFGGMLVVRTRLDPYDVLPAVKAAVYAVLPDVPLRNVVTLEEVLAKQLAQRRLNMLLLGGFGLLGLVIAAVGIYGLMAFVVSQRTREIGVRIALGASRSNVVAIVVLKAFGLVVSGLIVGSAAAWYLSAAARALLFGLEPTDPRAFAAAAVSLLAAALVASVVPARRAASVDPVVALRSE